MADALVQCVKVLAGPDQQQQQLLQQPNSIVTPGNVQQGVIMSPGFTTPSSGTNRGPAPSSGTNRGPEVPVSYLEFCFYRFSRRDKDHDPANYVEVSLFDDFPFLENSVNFTNQNSEFGSSLLSKAGECDHFGVFDLSDDEDHQISIGMANIFFAEEGGRSYIIDTFRLSLIHI